MHTKVNSPMIVIDNILDSIKFYTVAIAYWEFYVLYDSSSSLVNMLQPTLVAHY